MSTHLLFLFSCCIGISCTRTSPFYGLFLLIFIHWDSTQSPCQSINMRQRFKLFIVGYTSVKVYHQTRCPKMGYTSSISIPPQLLITIIWIIRYGNTICLDWFGLINEWNGPSFTIRIYFLDIISAPSDYVAELAAYLTYGNVLHGFIVIVKALFHHHHTFGQYLIAYVICHPCPSTHVSALEYQVHFDC